MKRKIAATILTCFFLVAIISFFIPNMMQAWSKKARKADIRAGLPVRVDNKMTCQELAEGKYAFFGPKGETEYYYYYDSEAKFIEVYELMSENRTRPGWGDELSPMTRDAVNFLYNQICRKEANARKAEVEAKKAQQDAQRRAKLEFDRQAKEDAQRRLDIASLDAKRREIERKEKELAAKKDSPPAPKKPYHFAVVSGEKTGQQGIRVCDELAKTYTSIFNAGWMDFQAACQKAEKIILIENISYRSVDEQGGWTEVRCAISLAIIEAHTKKELSSLVTADVPLRAPNPSAAKERAFETAIKSAKVRLGKWM